MLEIRKALPADLPEIAAIQEACPEASHWPVSDYLLHDLRVALREGRIGGFLVARMVAADEGEILNLAVAPECRRLGVGRALLQSFLGTLSGSVFLEVRSSNTGAREFYKSLGFHEVTVRKNYYDSPPEHGVVMNFHSCYRDG